MPDLTLSTLLDAVEPKVLEPHLRAVAGEWVLPTAHESRRLQAPICYWAVFTDASGRRATFKGFFSGEVYADYAEQLQTLYPDRFDAPGHPSGALALLPEWNGVLWTFPFDPSMPGLVQCVDGAFIGDALGRDGPVRPEVRNYSPEVGALVAYQDPTQEELVAFGKVLPSGVSGTIYLAMDRLWKSRARRAGRLQVTRPLAYRPELGLLLQAPVPGAPVGRQRNRVVFRELAEHAGEAAAAVHAADIDFGPEQQLEALLQRLEAGQVDVGLTAPNLYATLRTLCSQLRERAGHSWPGPLVPSHGDFKYDQFLVDEGRFTLIDFEMFCQAEKEFDLGTFCAYLPSSQPEDWRDGVAVEVLRTAFLRTYERATGLALDFSRLALFEVTMLATRGLAQMWAHERGWELRTSQFLDLALDRLMDPFPRNVTEEGY